MIEGMRFTRIQNAEAQWAIVLDRDKSEERGLLSCVACGADLVGDVRDALRGTTKAPPVLGLFSDLMDSQTIRRTGLLCTWPRAGRWCCGTHAGPDRRPGDRMCPGLGQLSGIVLGGTEDPLRYGQRLLAAGRPLFTVSALRRFTEVLLALAFVFELPATVEQPTLDATEPAVGSASDRIE